MAIFNISNQDGWVKISESEAQFQIITTGETIAVLHSATVPLAGAETEFIAEGGGIQYSLGTTPCYVKVVSSGTAKIVAVEI